MTINEIHDAMGFKPILQSGVYGFEGVLATGEFKALSDYGAGILHVSIRVNRPGLHSGVAISTIDDGVWQTSGDVTKEDIDNIYKRWALYWGYILPSEHMVNELLREFGLFGMYTG